MNKIFDFVKMLLTKLRELIVMILQITIPVGIAMIFCDILLNTKFGIIDKIIGLLGKVGISNNVLTVLIIVILVLLYNDKGTGIRKV